MSTECLVLFVTTPDVESAKKIARGLVEERLAACVNVIPGLQSTYRWEGKIEEARESLLFIKTTRNQFSKIDSWIRKVHSYSVPEVIAVPIAEGSQAYLSWLEESVS